MHTAETNYLQENFQIKAGSVGTVDATDAKDLPYGVAMPDHVIQFPFGGGPTTLIASENSSTLYVGMYKGSLDFGRVLDQYLHWWSMPLAAIILALAVGRMVRTSHKPQLKGQPYCRKCNYNLAGITHRQCPECGVDTIMHPARHGRSFLMRSWLATLIAITCIAFLSVAWWAIPRTGLRLFSNADMCSEAALDWLKARGRNVSPQLKSFHTVLVEVDPLGGDWSRLSRLPSRAWPTVTRTADGLGLFASDYSGTQQRIIDVTIANGRVRRSALLPPDCEVGGLRTFVAGFSDDKSEVFVHYVNKKAQTNVLAAWNLTTGELRELATIPAFIDSKYNTVNGRRFQKVPGTHPVAFISYPTFPETYSSARYPITMFDRHGRVVSEIDLGIRVGSNAELCLSSDGASFFLPTDFRSREKYLDPDHMQRFEFAELLRGNLQPASVVPMPHNVWYQTASNSDGSLLFANCNGYVYVRDTKLRSWRAFLSVQTSHTGPHDMVLSPDSSWVAATTRIDRQADSTYFVTIWRVPAVPPGNPPASRTP